MKIKIKPGGLIYRFLIFMGVIFLKMWYMTLRVKRVDPLGVTTGKIAGNFCIAMWHNRILGMSLFHNKCRSNTVALASRSKDGQVISDFIRHFGIKNVRGSSNKEGRSKGGAAALIQCINALKEGHNICFTVDGPRGPKYKVQPGVIKASQKSGAKILPIIFNLNSYWEIKSWDRLQIPKPFSKLEVIIADPIEIDKAADEEQLKKCHEDLDRLMNEMIVDKKSK